MESLRDLNFEEMREVEGGRFFRTIKTIWDALAIQDAINEFRDGWNSHECDCKM
ncbi:hypothetical protein QWY93_01100 [Echinicola jeungdonensis]|uniref:Bacteriocin-type signal sequence n=1 Tax=Echinicola jeungdonensis TaxID=709343 RepID=A0ABV5J2R7_9BACT|nr:hypothetical protein [Echinicola jeungdonensis]MDN3667938.1 hypothetical protein [Echinicola jeungdonensis]